MRKTSLVAVDLDGTLLTGDGAPAPEGAGLLRQAARAGVRVVLATTRNPHSALHFCRLLALDDPMICTNGAQIWASPDGPVWACHTIRREVALAIARLADTHGWELSTTVGPMTHWRRRPGQALGPLTSHAVIVASNSDAIIDDPVRILVSQPEAVGAIRSLCRSEFAGRCRTETYYRADGSVHSLGVFPPEADKGTALEMVRGRLGIRREEVLAIGDNPNDVPMFRQAGVSVAVANAPGEVRREANLVAPSNDAEGVAWALRAVGLV